MTDEMGDSGPVETGGGGDAPAAPAGGEAPNPGLEDAASVEGDGLGPEADDGVQGGDLGQDADGPDLADDPGDGEATTADWNPHGAQLEAPEFGDEGTVAKQGGATENDQGGEADRDDAAQRSGEEQEQEGGEADLGEAAALRAASSEGPNLARPESTRVEGRPYRVEGARPPEGPAGSPPPDGPPPHPLGDRPTELSAREVARRLADRAREAEPEVTTGLEEAAEGSGGEMAGLEHRFKSEDSLTRKIEGQAAALGISNEEAGARIKDALRYTITFSEGDLVGGANRVLGDLEKQGYKVNEIKNYWVDGNPYMGVNTVLTTPSGQAFELQFHTPPSFAAKMGIHKEYEEFRQPETAVARKQQLFDEMARISGQLEHPRDIVALGQASPIPRPT